LCAFVFPIATCDFGPHLSLSLYHPKCRSARQVHHDDWVGTTWMDTMEPCFEDLIVEQLQRHIDKFPNTFEGIAIDRLDYSEAYNYDRDDNISWVPLAPQKVS
jgi:hypothetical protein